MVWLPDDEKKIRLVVLVIHEREFCRNDRTQLLVWCWILVFVWSRDTSTEAATLVTCQTHNQIQAVYIDVSNSHWACTTVGYLAHWVQSIAESSRRPGLRSANTADYVKRRTRTKFGERCFSQAAPAAWKFLPDSRWTVLQSSCSSCLEVLTWQQVNGASVKLLQLPGSSYLTALGFSQAAPAAWKFLPDSIRLTTDANRFKNILKTHLFHLAFWYLLATLDNL